MQRRNNAESPTTTTISIDQHVIPNNAPTLNVLIQMKNDNKSDYTINFTRKALNFLARHTSLGEPEAVKDFIAQIKTSDSYKRNLCIAYNKYCKFYKIEWTMSLYLPEAKNIKLPTKEKLLMLIAKARIPTSIKLKLSMETGLRPVELCRLKVNDLDLEHRTVNPTTAKKRQSENAENIATTHRIHQRMDNQKQPESERQNIQRKRGRLRKTLSRHAKQTRQRSQRPVNPHHQTI
jgi:integrase